MRVLFYHCVDAHSLRKSMTCVAHMSMTRVARKHSANSRLIAQFKAKTVRVYYLHLKRFFSSKMKNVKILYKTSNTEFFSFLNFLGVA